MLTDCILKDPADNELLIAQEGDIAEMLKETSRRRRMTQAVLDAGDWELDTEHAELGVVLDPEGVKDFIAALGIGIDLDIRPLLTIEKLRYGKLILVTRSGALGQAIRRQLLGFMFRYQYPVLASGRVYAVEILETDLTEALLAEKILDASTRELRPMKVGETHAETLAINA